MATEEFNDDLPIDSPERKRLPLLLRRAWYGLNQAFRRQISHAGATPDQFTALRTLCEGDPAGLTQSELTRAMSSDPNTVASLLERMENNGWLERKPHETIAAPSASSSCHQVVRNIPNCATAPSICRATCSPPSPPTAAMPFWKNSPKVADACHAAAAEAGRKNRD